MYWGVGQQPAKLSAAPQGPTGLYMGTVQVQTAFMIEEAQTSVYKVVLFIHLYRHQSWTLKKNETGQMD